MKNYKIWLAVVLLLLIVNSAVLAVVWFRKGGHGRMNHQGPQPAAGQHYIKPGMQAKDVIIKTLALTQKQQDAYALMVNKHQQTTSKLNDANRKLRDSLFSYIKKPSVDSAVINSITKKISDNQVGLEKATLYHFRSLRAILTTNQQTKFDTIINDVLHMMGGPGNGPGGPGKGGPGNGMQPGGMGRAHGHRGMPPGGDKMSDGRDMPPPPGDRPPPPRDGKRRDPNTPPPPGGMPPPPGGGKMGDPHGPPPPPPEDVTLPPAHN